MCRNFKTLGLAFVGVLATSAALVSTAQAAPQFTASSYPATATGANTGGGETFTMLGAMSCDSHFEGSLSAASSTLTMTPNYGNCSGHFLNMSIVENGCDYLLQSTARLGEGHYRHKVDIQCAGSNSIAIVGGTCEVKIGAQTGLNSVTTVNTGSSVTLVWNVANITMSVTKDGFGCTFSGTGHIVGAYHGHVTLSGVGGGSIAISGS